MLTGTKEHEVTDTASNGHRSPEPSPGSMEERWGVEAPVAVVQDFYGVTLAEYDRMIRSLDLVPGGPSLPGCLFHWVREKPDGVRIIEVWRNRSMFDFLWSQEVVPVTRYLRLPDPELTFYDVPTYLTAGSGVRP